MTKKRFKADNYYFEIWDNDEFLLSFDQTVNLLNQLNDENEQLKEEKQALQRHIQRSTFNKIRVEDVFNCAKYDKFYDNEEAIKSIDWIAEQLGVDFE